MQNQITAAIGSLVEVLPEMEQRLVLEIVRRFVPDDVATPEDMAAIEAAEEDARHGGIFKSENIDWDNLDKLIIAGE